MKIVAILQARLGSTRLPNKVLMPLAGAPMVQRIIERVKRAKLVHEVVLAVPICDVMLWDAIDLGRAQFYAYPGDEHDLVGRYLHCAAAFHADIVVRIPCDNPCIDPLIIDEAVDEYLSLPKIYVSTMYRQVRDRVYVDGVGAEVLSYSRLQWLDQKTHGQSSYREHPHLLFQDQRLIDGWEQYQRCANYNETIRLDVNTQADYEFVSDIYDHCYPKNPDFGLAEILTYLDSKKVLA